MMELQKTVFMVRWRLLFALFVALESPKYILTVDNSCTQQNVGFKETHTAFFKWRLSTGSRDISWSEFYFGELTVIATIFDHKQEEVNRNYTERFELLHHSTNEIYFRLKTVTQQDAGVYECCIFTNTGETYCHKWNLTVHITRRSSSNFHTVDNSCTHQNITCKENTDAFFQWWLDIDSREIWWSRLYFDESVIATRTIFEPANEEVNENYTKRYELFRHSNDEIYFRLKTVTQQDAGVYDRYIVTNTGDTYCHEWNLIVVQRHSTTQNVPTCSNITTTDTTRPRPSVASKGSISAEVTETFTKCVSQTAQFNVRFKDTGHTIRVTRLYWNSVLIATKSLKRECLDKKYTNRYQFNFISHTEAEFALQELDLDDTGQYEGVIIQWDGVHTIKHWRLTVKALSHCTDKINNTSTAGPVAEIRNRRLKLDGVQNSNHDLDVVHFWIGMTDAIHSNSHVSVCEHADARFTWKYSSRIADIRWSKIYFKTTEKIHITENGHIKTRNENDSAHYSLVYRTEFKAQFLLKNVSQQDSGVYMHTIVTEEGTTYEKEWHLDVKAHVGHESMKESSSTSVYAHVGHESTKKSSSTSQCAHVGHDSTKKSSSTSQCGELHVALLFGLLLACMIETA